MTHANTAFGQDRLEFDASIDQACRAIPPAWPLASSVAVNPFLGQLHEDLSTVAARLARVAGSPVTMPRTWYLDQIADGHITETDLREALAAAPAFLRPSSFEALKAALHTEGVQSRALPSVADLAAEVSGIDWPGLIAERFGAWAAGYLDEGQALWAAPRGRGAYAAWRAFATHDLTPEIVGLSGFAAHVLAAPETAFHSITSVVHHLGIPAAAAQTYFHLLLMTLGGWAQYARYMQWQAELGGSSDTTISDFLAVRLVWEAALFDRYEGQISERWQSVLATHAQPVTPNINHVIDAILQEAVERAAQRNLALTLGTPGKAVPASRPLLQAAFCIDVRSEVFRRALETISSAIQTLGFAGFFGLPASHRRFASDIAEHRLPVLLNPGLSTRAGSADDAAADQSVRFKVRARRAWGRFKLAAVSSFAFVEATGPLYVYKLVIDALGLRATPAPNDPAPHPDPALDLDARVAAAANVLRAMSLTSDFARLVILAGHGANVVNNPHASGLHCGACGGYSGEVNARLLATLLNDTEVRSGLVEMGIAIPLDTVFVGALHDTTTDAVTLYAEDCAPHAPLDELEKARTWLAAAGRIARGERALRLPRGAGESSLSGRSRDWAEVRPEWGLAGCKAFIAAPRRRTIGKSLEGRAFLHDYDWKTDKDFGVLELILTAPVVVASWISLQYYGSTVAPDTFGGGNKLLHNVVGGIGVIEGNGGSLRAGLPWQSVHDGERYVHEPMRLSVAIEAPRQAMTDILSRNPEVRALFDNRWLHLFALDDAGRMAWRYTGDGNWAPLISEDPPGLAPEMAA